MTKEQRIKNVEEATMKAMIELKEQGKLTSEVSTKMITNQINQIISIVNE